MLVLAAITAAIGAVLTVMVVDVWRETGLSQPLPCERLPPARQVSEVLTRHGAEWEEVRGLSEGAGVDAERCQGKADLVIYYATGKDRAAIQRLIGATFHGIPYRMFNV